MLLEIQSPAFKNKGKERDPIKFHEGLNVILGMDDGHNSIGKSSTLLAIDFVFGGNTYIKSDGVKHIDHHTIFFAFKFEGKTYNFSRNTATPDEIHKCRNDYTITGDFFTRDEFADWLKEKYEIAYPGLKFRQTMSSFFRVYGKENLDEKRPLRGLPGDSMEKSIMRLVKLYNRYGDIEMYTTMLNEAESKLSAFKNARKYDFISNLVGGKKQYEENQISIKELEIELDNLTSEQIDEKSEIDIEKGKQKAHLKDKKLRIETEIERKRNRRQLIGMSVEYGLYPTEADLMELKKFFPDVNLRKIYEVEKYHKKLAQILDQQFEEEAAAIQKEMDALIEDLKFVNMQIEELGFVGNVSKEFLDRHSELKGKIDALKIQNEAYLTQTQLQERKKRANDLLKESISNILYEIEEALNSKMKEFNDLLYVESRKAPHISFTAHNSYQFETPDDTGTGSNYKGMVVYDLAVLYLTALPAIAHDSLILKNIGDSAIDGIMKIYNNSTKQVFIAFDKAKSYTKDTYEIVKANTVLQLSDNNGELYGQSWNKEESES